MKSEKYSQGGLFTTLLQVAFIVLKLCKVIDWSWWWVLSPSWIPVGIILIGLMIYGGGTLLKEKTEEKKKANSKWLRDESKRIFDEL